MRRAAARHEMLEPAEIARHVRHRQRPFLRDDRRHEKAVARVADRRLEQVCERQRAEALRQRAPAGNRARDRDRLPAAFVHRGSAGEALGRPRLRRAARRIQSDQLAAGPQDREEIRPEAVAARFDQRERDRGGERGVDRVAAAGEHRDTRLRGERLGRGDRVAREDRLPARRVGQVPVEGDARCRGVVHVAAPKSRCLRLRSVGARCPSVQQRKKRGRPMGLPLLVKPRWRAVARSCVYTPPFARNSLKYLSRYAACKRCCSCGFTSSNGGTFASRTSSTRITW